MLIGVSTVGKAFTKQVVEKMTKWNERPIIFALSNPTDHAECTAQETYEWSNGKAIYAAGVQFDPVQIKSETYHPGQANNFYIFPAVGLAIYVTQASRVPDDVFIAAARATADQVTPEELEKGMLFPPQKDIQKAAIKTAIAAAQKLFELNLARVDMPKDLTVLVPSQLYKPEYAAQRNAAAAV
jgi:malate dehydrogenase (oxaloacetate-decarboxylating)(NADP+)